MKDRRPSGARYLIGWTMAPMCKSRYAVHLVAVDVKGTGTIVDQAFLVAKCVRLAIISESYSSYSVRCSCSSRKNQGRIRSITWKKLHGIC